MNFIYVTNEKDIKSLQAKGYELFKITNNGVHIFINKTPNQMEFKDNSNIVYTNTITF